jgi:hypothetical protein
MFSIDWNEWCAAVRICDSSRGRLSRSPSSRGGRFWGCQPGPNAEDQCRGLRAAGIYVLAATLDRARAGSPLWRSSDRALAFLARVLAVVRDGSSNHESGTAHSRPALRKCIARRNYGIAFFGAATQKHSEAHIRNRALSPCYARAHLRPRIRYDGHDQQAARRAILRFVSSFGC